MSVNVAVRQRNAHALASALWRLLAGNPNAVPVQRPNGSWYPDEREYTQDDVIDHVLGRATYGVYVVDPETNTSRFCCFDFDGPGARDDAEKVYRALLKGLVRRNAMFVEFSGKKGWHIWVCLDAPTPVRDLMRWGRHIKDAAGVECEFFPKGEVIPGGLGNLVKLPLALHRVSKRWSYITGYPGHTALQDELGHLEAVVPLRQFEFGAMLSRIPKREVNVPDEYGTAPENVLDQRKYAEAVLKNGAERIREAETGTRNMTLFKVAASAYQLGFIPDEAIEQTFADAAEDAGLSRWEIERTLRSASARASVDSR